MMACKFKIIGLLLLLFLPELVSAQALPTIPQTSSVKVGTLPNKVRYYLAPNNTSKGYANFVLVQKGQDRSDRSRELLRRLPHFRKTSPYDFLASKGVGYGPEGYISYRDGNTVFTFQDVPTFDGAACDSTILLIFDLVQDFPGEQAIIVAGDYSNNDIEGKLQVFSLTVTPRGSSAKETAYRWNPSATAEFVHTENNTAALAAISCTWNSPRTPANRLKTPQPLVSYMYATELQYIVEKRLRARFVKDNIPLADFRSNYYSSAASAGDERYEFSATFGIADLPRAEKAMVSIFAEMDARGASLEELAEAKEAMLRKAAKSLSSPVENESLCEQCISAYLYGTNLASSDAVSSFFARRRISPERELELFNSFVSALLDPSRALRVRCDTPQGHFDGDAFMAEFASAWATAAARPASPELYRPSHSDTLSILTPKTHKVTVKTSTADPVTGGDIWTFSNGIRVIYKRMPGLGYINYGLLLKGGYSGVPNIGPGESAFVSDMLGLFRVGGMSSTGFHNMLEANGIEMRGEASLTDVKLCGTAPSDKIELLLKALLTFSVDRKPDTEAFRYYKACEALRQAKTRVSRDGIIAAIDSTMCPDYYYPSTKSVDRLGDDLLERVDIYLKEQFAKFSDGLLVLIGDISPSDAQAVLGRYLGNFTVSSDFSVRPKVEYNLRPGWSTYTVEASHSSVGSGEVCVNLGMATRQPFSIRSYCAFLIASTAVEIAVTEALAHVGMYSEVIVDTQVFPAERLAMFVTCRPCQEDGLPAGVLPAETFQVLRALRMGISKVSAGTLTEARLKQLKQAVKAVMDSYVAQPDNLMKAVMMRNSECKDIVSNYSAALASVTLSDVNTILHDLDFGSKVEYIIR